MVAAFAAHLKQRSRAFDVAFIGRERQLPDAVAEAAAGPQHHGLLS
jgi:hypothetical protein